MGYKAVTRFKLEKGKYIERGESVDVSGEDAERLLASGSIVEDGDFEEQFPEGEEPDNQPPGTPSNLEQIEGTSLAAGKTGQGDSDGFDDEDEE